MMKEVNEESCVELLTVLCFEVGNEKPEQHHARLLYTSQEPNTYSCWQIPLAFILANEALRKNTS